MDALTRDEIKSLGLRLAAVGLDELNEVDYQVFRTGFAGALGEVTNALNRCASSALAGRRTEVGSRIKAIDSVVAKLQRKETSLSTMQDIAGCRLTVPTMDDLQTATGWLHDNLTIERTKDYTRQGQKGGYRAVHLIVVTASGRYAEIQIRTEVQHAWANLSEKLAYSIDRLIKAGGGPADVRRRLLALSHQGWLVDSLMEQLRTTRGLLEELSYPVQREFADARASSEWSLLNEAVGDFRNSLVATDTLCERLKDALIALMAALRPEVESDER